MSLNLIQCLIKVCFSRTRHDRQRKLWIFVDLKGLALGFYEMNQLYEPANLDGNFAKQTMKTSLS